VYCNGYTSAFTLFNYKPFFLKHCFSTSLKIPAQSLINKYTILFKNFKMAEVYPEYNEEYDESTDDSSSSIDPYKATSQYHIQQAEMAIQNLKYIVREPGWKKILQHKSGASIYNKLGVTDIPVYMGEHVIEGFTPRAIFAVIGMRKLWDDWYVFVAQLLRFVSFPIGSRILGSCVNALFPN
jgi:hypothetical protein